MPPIVYPVQFAFPEPTFFALWNIFSALSATIWLVAMVAQNPWRVGRPAFAFAGLVNLLFQWPIVFLATPLEQSLSTPFYFTLTENIVVFGGTAWVLLTDRLTIPAGTKSDRSLRPVHLAIPIAAAVIFASIYFSRMPLHCTALYALLYDPASTLLAREVTIKLAGSTVASSSYGALANTVAPVIAAIGATQAIRGITVRRPLWSLLWLMAILASLTLVMIAGAKGLTIPLLGLVFLSAVYWASGFWRKIAAGIVSVICVVVALSTFELMRERGGGSIPYNFVGCTTQLGSAKQGAELLRSIKDGGLGLSKQQAAELEAQLTSLVKEGGGPQRTFGQARRPDAERAGTYVEAIFNRAFMTPTQVAAWHFLYVEQHGSPGLGAFPLAKKLFGYSIDTASLVYMAYGSIYSGGDLTSTSTAPTSFIFSWPAYFGVWGIALAIACVLALDVGVALILLQSPKNILPIGVGLVVVIGFNMITSDFVVVMLSHGGGVAVMILAIYAAIEMWRRGAIGTREIR